MSRFALGLMKGGVGNDAFTKALLHFDGNTTESGANATAKTWTQNGGSFTTGEFGSAFSSGGSGWVDTPDSTDFTLGSGDFTVDCWFNVQGGSSATRYAFGQCDSTASVASLSALGGVNAANKLFSSISIGGGASVVAIVGTTVFSAAGWHHFALTRSGGTARLFLDGTLEASAAISGTVTDSANKFAVGRAGENASNVWNGFIDEFRLSVGIARWTSNFTPPGVAYS